MVHAVRSEASGLANAVRAGVVDKNDICWRGEEGSGGRRGPGGAAPAQAPFLSSPMGSKRLEGISVEEAMVTRTQLLEEELSSLKEELALCQVSRWPPAFPLHSGAGAGPVGRRSPSLCLRLRRCAGSGPTRLRPAALPPGFHTQPCPLLSAGWRSSAPLPDLGLPLLPGQAGQSSPRRPRLVFFTWIPRKRVVAPSPASRPPEAQVLGCSCL